MTTQDEQSRIERELREALAERARQVRPSARLDAILEEASEPDVGAGRGRWLAGLAVAAAAAVVAGTVWVAGPDREPALPGGPATTTPPSTSSPSTSPTTSDTPSPSATSSPSPSTSAPTTTTAALAIYRVGTNGGAANRPGLVREYHSASVPSSEAGRVKAAVAEALTRTELWRGTSVNEVDVTRTAITLRLSGSGAEAPDADSARLASHALAWTAQGAVGRGDLPVSIRAEGSGQLLGQLDASTTFTRAATPPEALCDIWVDEPAPGATLQQAKAVIVRGQAVAWEANVEWELRRGTTAVRDGFVTASIGAPSRGTFSVDLGRLEPGTYTFRAFTSSAKDGSTVAERLVTFTVG